MCLTWDPDALPEGISLESPLAGADGVVVVDVAEGVDAAHSHARVRALLVDASQVGGALRGDKCIRYNSFAS